MTISRLTKWIGAIVILGYLGTLIASQYSISVLKVGWPIYNRIAMGKDLVADILPPPAYLIESYLEATLALQGALDATHSQSDTDLAKHAERLKALQKDYEDRHTFWRTQDLSDGLKAAFLTGSYEPGEQFWKTVNERFLPALAKNDKAEARRAYGDITKLYLQHRAQIDKTVEIANKENDAFLQDAGRQETVDVAVMWAVALLVLGLVVVAAAGVLFRIVGPVNKLKEVMGELASGDHNLDLQFTSRSDEIGEMARAVDVFRTNAIERERLEAAAKETREKEVLRQQALDRYLLIFKDAITQNLEILLQEVDRLRHSSGLLLSSADQSSREAGSAANSCSEAASSAQAVAAATEELNASIREIAGQAQHTSSIVGETTEKAKVTDQEVGKLTEAVNKIDSVITLIRTIAQQTNLLALNATIESARAGEAGRGFAVVAAEVKALSEQTAKATEEIAQQIQTVQVTTETAATAIRAIGSQVGEIHSLATSVAAAVEEQQAATADIARNVHIAATGSQEAAESSRIVTEVAEQTGSEAKQVSSASDQLQAVSTAVQKAIQDFINAVSSDLHERRHAARRSVEKAIIITRNGDRHESRAINVSETGMRVSIVNGLTFGDTVSVDFGFGRAQAKVVWLTPEACGLEFVKSVSPEVIADPRWKQENEGRRAA